MDRLFLKLSERITSLKKPHEQYHQFPIYFEIGFDAYSESYPFPPEFHYQDLLKLQRMF